MPLIFSWVFHVPFANTLCFSADINFFYHLFQVSSSLISRVSTADQNFNKDMELTPRIATEFDLTLDSGPALHAIQTMNFFQLKGTAAVLSKFSNLLWRWRSDLAHYESEYSFFPSYSMYAWNKKVHVCIIIDIRFTCAWIWIVPSNFKTFFLKCLGLKLKKKIIFNYLIEINKESWDNQKIQFLFLLEGQKLLEACTFKCKGNQFSTVQVLQTLSKRRKFSQKL